MYVAVSAKETTNFKEKKQDYKRGFKRGNRMKKQCNYFIISK